MSNLYDCPRCGKPESSWGDTFCGECEDKYRKELFDYQEERIREIDKELLNYPGEMSLCSRAIRLSVEKLSLLGREDEAISLLNQ